MRSAFLLLVGISLFDCAASFTFAEKDIEFQHVIEVTGGKDTLFPKALQWLAQTYNDSKEVIEYEDEAVGKIIGRGSTQVMWRPGGRSMSTMIILYSIVIEIKDNKVRVTFNNFYISEFPGHPIYQDSYDQLVPILETLIVNLTSYLSEEDEKW